MYALYRPKHSDCQFYGKWVEDKTLDCYNCPPEGSFVGWKVAMVFGRTSKGSCEFCLIQLRIPADSPRLRAYDSKKCRCKYAEVIDIQLFGGGSLPDDIIAYSMFEMNAFANPSLRHRTKYKKREIVSADGWDGDRTIECGHGIHFFMCRDDAISYVMR